MTDSFPKKNRRAFTFRLSAPLRGWAWASFAGVVVPIAFWLPLWGWAVAAVTVPVGWAVALVAIVLWPK